MSRANNKISTVFPRQVPFFIREDHPTTVKFLEKYYEFLEEHKSNFNEGRPVERIIRHLENIDIDHTNHDEAAEYLYKKFIQDIPVSINADRKILLKNIKDFYRAKGTEKATKFLLYALTGFANTEIYYPKRDILKASDGKWYIQKSLRVSNTHIEGISNTNLTGLEKYIGRRVTGNTSNASALVESVDRFYQQGTQIDELILSNIDGSFENGEKILSNFINDGNVYDITSDVFGGIINSIKIINQGTGYQIGDPVVIVSSNGSGACVVVSGVSTGNIRSISVLSSGAGFQQNNAVLITGGGGTGAIAHVDSVDVSEEFHPNTYNIVSSIVALEANTPVSNSVYSNLNPILVDPANSAVSNSMHFFTYSNTGPITGVYITNPGTGYVSTPSIDASANGIVKLYGILGRMSINNGGINYAIGDTIEFLGGDGYGAAANVTNVAANGMITEVKFQPVTGMPVGGAGYKQTNLPSVNVSSNTGTSANITVTAILGDGESFLAANTTLGAIERITIISGGLGYDTPPTVDLTGSGDGTATGNATVVSGVYSYPGRYLNDDGFLSSYNFLQDRDFYQLFSYVLKTGVSIDDYRTTLLKLAHPAGMKLFGEYQLLDMDSLQQITSNVSTVQERIILEKSYTKTGNTINISYTSHGLSNLTNIYMEFVSGDMANVENGIYTITVTSNNYIMAISNTSNSTSGNVEIGIPRT